MLFSCGPFIVAVGHSRSAARRRVLIAWPSYQGREDRQPGPATQEVALSMRSAAGPYPVRAATKPEASGANLEGRGTRRAWTETAAPAAVCHVLR